MVASRTSIAALNLRTSDGEYTGDPSKGPPVRSVSWNVADRSATPLDQCVTYEEYHPFGTTSWWATNGSTDVSAKRYRYTGKERDDETGLGYHGARYYAAWLGRWERPDPSGITDGVNRYQYVRGNPITFSDPTGNASYANMLADIAEMPENTLYERATKNVLYAAGTVGLQLESVAMAGAHPVEAAQAVFGATPFGHASAAYAAAGGGTAGLYAGEQAFFSYGPTVAAPAVGRALLAPTHLYEAQLQTATGLTPPSRVVRSEGVWFWS